MKTSLIGKTNHVISAYLSVFKDVELESDIALFLGFYFVAIGDCGV